MSIDIESLKRVLLATKAKARGMRKDKLEGRLNPKAPDEPAALEGSDEEEAAEPMDERMSEMDDEMSDMDKEMGGGDLADDAPEPTGPPSEEEKAAALDEIRKLLARS